MKKFIGILLSTTFIFSGNLLGASDFKDINVNDASSELNDINVNDASSDLNDINVNDASSDLNVDYFKDLKVDNYIIGPGDTLSVVISYAYPELSRDVVVDGEGTIYLPKIKRIFVKGLTSTELVDLLDKSYGQFINFPEVEISIVKYRPIRVLVEGEIDNPGLLTMRGATELDRELGTEDSLLLPKDISFTVVPSFYFPTVFDAIRGSGGITPNSDLSNIQVIRQSTLSEGGGQKVATLNFENLLNYGDNSQNIRIYDGDIIKVSKAKEINTKKINKAVKSNLNPKFINVYVTGRVLEPGSKSIPKTTTLNDAIDISGGTKILRGKIRYIRFNNDGSIDKRKIAYSPRAKRGSYKNPLLSNGDLIFVGNSILSNTTEVLGEVTAPLSGLFSAYALVKILNE